MKNNRYRVKYPEKESATAFISDDGKPFLRAVIGETYPLYNYYVTRSAASRVFDFEYVAEGEGEILLDGEWRSAAAGDVFILRPGVPHRYRACPGSPWHKLWINYVADYTDAFMDAYGVQSGIYHIPELSACFERALKLSHNASSPNDLRYEIAGYVHEIVSSVAARASRETKSDEKRIKEALDGAIYRKADLAELSEKLHMSKSNMIRIFRKNFGMTPYDYLLASKIEAAKLLLVSTEMAMKEIAEKLCISDEHYFSSLFMQRVGMRPKEYRFSHRGERI